MEEVADFKGKRICDLFCVSYVGGGKFVKMEKLRTDFREGLRFIFSFIKFDKEVTIWME